MGTRSRKSKMPISDDFLTGPALENLSGYLEDPFPSFPRATANQQKSLSTKSKKSTQQETTTPAEHQPLSLDKQIQLEQLKHGNLQLQLEITRAQLELTKLSPHVKPSQTSRSLKPEEPSPLDNILASTPFRSPTQEVLAEDGSVPTLKDLRTKDKKERKHPSLLPNDYLFSAKGKIDYDKLEISEFVGGFLEFLNGQPESAQQRYLAYLKLLMERAATYSWYSVRNFHFSINTAVEAGRLSLQQFDQSKDGAQTFFTHTNLPSVPTTPRVSTTSSQARNSKKDTYCKEWNYTGKCNCSLTEATYKSIHRCRVCDADHAMLQCAKRRFPIPSSFTGTPKSEDKN